MAVKFADLGAPVNANLTLGDLFVISNALYQERHQVAALPSSDVTDMAVAGYNRIIDKVECAIATEKARQGREG